MSCYLFRFYSKVFTSGRYTKISLRDIVEEDAIARGVRDVCEVLGEFLCPLLSDLGGLTYMQTLQGCILLRHTFTAKPENHVL